MTMVKNELDLDMDDSYSQSTSEDFKDMQEFIDCAPTSNNISKEISLSYDDLSNNSVIKFKLSSGELKVIDVTGRSRIWDVFQKLQDQHGNTIPGVVLCKICTHIYKYNKATTSNLVKHKCYATKKFRPSDLQVEANVEDKVESTRLFIKWTLQNCRPFQICEDNGFQDFIKFCVSAGAKYGQSLNIKSLLPNSITLSRIFNKLNGGYLNRVKQDLSLINDNEFALTSDMWTENYLRKTFIAVTIHYILEGSMVNRVLGFKCVENENCTDANIESKVLEILSEFNCSPSDKLNVVTDMDSKIISAFNNHNRLNCVAHLLYDCVKTSMKSVAEVEELCSACNEIAKFVKTSGIKSSFEIAFTGCPPTSWISMYYLLLAADKYWAQIENILQENGGSSLITNVNIAHIRAILKVLHPFEETFKNLEEEKRPTVHLVHLYINRLKKKLASDVNDLEIIAKFKSSLLTHLEAMVLNNLSIFHRIALFLFPPARKLVQFTEKEKLETKEKCMSFINTFDETALAVDYVETKPSLSSINSELLCDYLTPAETNVYNNNIRRELTEYENENIIFYDDFDVLQWWNVNKLRFPLLYKLSCRILAIPSSSSAAERVFVSGRQLLSEKRSTLGDDELLIETILLLHSHIEEQFLKEILEQFGA